MGMSCVVRSICLYNILMGFPLSSGTEWSPWLICFLSTLASFSFTNFLKTAVKTWDSQHSPSTLWSHQGEINLFQNAGLSASHKAARQGCSEQGKSGDIIEFLFVYSNPGTKLWSRTAIPAVCAIGRADGMFGIFCQFCEIFIGVSVSLEPLLMKMHTLQSFPWKGTPCKQQH